MTTIQQDPMRPVQDTLPALNPSGLAGSRPDAPNQGISAAQPAFDIAGMSDIGRQRDTNEDHFLIANLERAVRLQETNVPSTPGLKITSRQGTILVVADGLGGHGHGDVASAVTVDALLGYVTRFMPWYSIVDERHDAEMLAAFQTSVEESQRRVEQVAQRKGPDFSKIGTTLTVAFVDWPALLVAHVGDSRCYRMRAGVLSLMTADHTVGAELRRRGAEESVASTYDNVLTNVVGADSRRPQAECHRHRLQQGDTVVLCSDGLTAHVPDDDIGAVLSRAGDSRAACGELIALANARGGIDNITVVVMRC